MGTNSRYSYFYWKADSANSMIERAEIDRLLPAIYEASAEPEAWMDVLETIRDCANLSTTLLGVLPADQMWQGVMWGANLDPASVDACLQPGVIDQSVFAHALTHMPRGSLADLYTAGDQAIYNDPGAQALLTAQSLSEGVFGTITRDSRVITGLACLNETSRGALDDGSVRWIKSLVPHFSRSLAISRRIEQLRHEAASLRGAFGQLAIGVMGVAAGLTLRYTNNEAERILGADDGLAQHGRRLSLVDHGLKARLRATVACFATQAVGSGPHCLFVPRPSGAPSYTLVVAPGGASASAGCPVAAATLFVTDPVGPTALPAPALLAEGFGLTATEAEVARLVAMGRGMKFVAESLGVSLNTARTHLKSIYAKTGVNHQAALTRTIADRFPPVVGLQIDESKT